MNAQTGDIVLLAPAKGTESFFQRAIQTMGSISTHNELIYVDHEGDAWVGSAQTPHFKTIPLIERIADCKVGKSDMLICRWKEWPLSDDISPRYAEWQRSIEGKLLLLGEMKPQYDKTAIRTIVRNTFRHLFGWRQILSQKEHQVYCTEVCEKITRLTGTFLFRSIPKQAFYAPIHVERILRIGEIHPIDGGNFGLMERLILH